MLKSAFVRDNLLGSRERVVTAGIAMATAKQNVFTSSIIIYRRQRKKGGGKKYKMASSCGRWHFKFFMAFLNDHRHFLQRRVFWTVGLINI